MEKFSYRRRADVEKQVPSSGPRIFFPRVPQAPKAVVSVPTLACLGTELPTYPFVLEHQQLGPYKKPDAIL